MKIPTSQLLQSILFISVFCFASLSTAYVQSTGGAQVRRVDEGGQVISDTSWRIANGQVYTTSDAVSPLPAVGPSNHHRLFVSAKAGYVAKYSWCLYPVGGTECTEMNSKTPGGELIECSGEWCSVQFGIAAGQISKALIRYEKVDQ